MAQPSELDWLEIMLQECVPGGNSCDPQHVADSLRDWAKKYLVCRPQQTCPSSPAPQELAARRWQRLETVLSTGAEMSVTAPGRRLDDTIRDVATLREWMDDAKTLSPGVVHDAHA